MEPEGEPECLKEKSPPQKRLVDYGGHHMESTRVTEEKLPGNVELRVNQLQEGCM